MAKPLIYLDHNALIDVIEFRKPAFSRSVRKFCGVHAQLVYAPPHIEEIANIYRSKASDADCERYIFTHLDGIRELTDSWELLPNDQPNGAGRIVQEDPQVCFQRVIDHYELTYFAEGVEGTLRDFVPSIQSSPTPDNAFADDKLLTIWKNRMYNRNFEPDDYPNGKELKKSFKVAEGLIDICFRSLHDAGFGLESKGKTRSGIHDVSHAIYATMADYFVSGDTRMLGKTKATFRFLNAECNPLSLDEFMTHVSSIQTEEAQQTGRGTE